MKSLSLLLIAVLLAAGCGSNSIFIGNTEITEHDVKLLLKNISGTARLVSAHESDYIIEKGPEQYKNLVVITRGTVRIAGKIFTNQKPIVINIMSDMHFATGETKEIGTDYFVYVLPAPIGKSFRAVISRHHPDWKGYYSLKGGSLPREYSESTWKLLGYFHVNPQGGIIRNSVMTNDNLNDPAPGIPLPGMVRINDFAIDIYENSELNGHCVSMYGFPPITNISHEDAQIKAKLYGKMLPSSKQWLAACNPSNFPQVLSIKPKESEGAHNIWSGQIAPTGYFASKDGDNLSLVGCADMLGNVWEWCDEVLGFDDFEKMPVTDSGYITETGQFSGLPYWPTSISRKRPVDCFGYFTFDKSKNHACLARGASSEDGDKAGPGSLLLNMSREETSPKVGFRCVR